MNRDIGCNGTERRLNRHDLLGEPIHELRSVAASDLELRRTE